MATVTTVGIQLFIYHAYFLGVVIEEIRVLLEHLSFMPMNRLDPTSEIRESHRHTSWMNILIQKSEPPQNSQVLWVLIWCYKQNILMWQGIIKIEAE